jgi:hypothetical protein
MNAVPAMTQELKRSRMIVRVHEVADDECDAGPLPWSDYGLRCLKETCNAIRPTLCDHAKDCGNPTAADERSSRLTRKDSDRDDRMAQQR